MNKIRKSFSNFMNMLTDDQKRSKILGQFVYVAFFLIASFMSVLNIFTKQYILLIATASFAVLCAAAFIINKYNQKNAQAASVLFAIGAVILFTYFIITGGVDNFSIIWLLLLPAMGLFFFGIKNGSILSLTILIILLVCFNVPAIRSFCTDYGDTFRMRFPIVYTACYGVSLLLETIRYYTSLELSNISKKYKFLYNHDSLTGTFNRYTLYDDYEKACKESNEKVSILIFDIDHFKQFNDTYGHHVGDIVLKTITGIIQASVPEGTSLYRWGGEEFVVLYSSGSGTFENVQKWHKEVADYEYDVEGKKVHATVSVGMVVGDKEEMLKLGITAVMQKADELLYSAKNAGRNKIIKNDL